MFTPEQLDELEASAVAAITRTYGPDFTDTERFWVQKGIEGMRYALATEDDDDVIDPDGHDAFHGSEV